MKKQTPVATAASIPGKYISFILAAFAGVIYLNTLSHGFVLDDVAVIGSNKYVQQGIGGIPKILTSFYWQGYWDLNSGLYRPLSLIMFALEWQLMPNNPFIHHLVQVLLYSFTIYQLFRLLDMFLSGYSIWLPAAVTLLFALHPIHTEVVANIKSRDEILCFLFFVLAAKEILKHRKATIAAVIYYSLCLFSKEAGLLYLPVFVLLQIQFGARTFKQASMALLPLAAVTAVWLGWHTYVIQALSPLRVSYTYADNSLLACSDVVSRVATGFMILGMYLVKSIWPYAMSYDYSFNQIPCQTGFPIAGIIAMAASGGLLYFAYRNFRKVPLISFGILYFFSTIFFASNVIYIIGSTMGDRLLFAPVLGTLICLCWLVYKLMGQLSAPKMTNPAMVIVLVAGLAYSYKTVARNAAWQSNSDLFETDMTAAPGSARVLYNYGTSVLGSTPESGSELNAVLSTAIDLYSRSVAIDSGYRDAYINLGAALHKLGRYEESIKANKKALQLDPTFTTLRMSIADDYFMMKRYDEAIAEYRWGFAHNLRQTKMYTFLGTALFNQQKYDLAIEVFKEGVTFDTTNAELWANYGNALGISQRYDEAIVAFSKSLQIKPNQKNILYFLSVTYRSKGDMAKADEYMRLSQ